uniref:Uncharacterized protein n=1 Tax=Romanomermis culicivorax TaxID=13658 RepID=A0A915HFE9_ROMCU
MDDTRLLTALLDYNFCGEFFRPTKHGTTEDFGPMLSANFRQNVIFHDWTKGRFNIQAYFVPFFLGMAFSIQHSSKLKIEYNIARIFWSYARRKLKIFILHPATEYSSEKPKVVMKCIKFYKENVGKKFKWTRNDIADMTDQLGSIVRSSDFESHVYELTVLKERDLVDGMDNIGFIFTSDYDMDYKIKPTFLSRKIAGQSQLIEIMPFIPKKVDERFLDKQLSNLMSNPAMKNTVKLFAAEFASHMVDTYKKNLARTKYSAEIGTHLPEAQCGFIHGNLISFQKSHGFKAEVTMEVDDDDVTSEFNIFLRREPIDDLKLVVHDYPILFDIVDTNPEMNSDQIEKRGFELMMDHMSIRYVSMSKSFADELLNTYINFEAQKAIVVQSDFHVSVMDYYDLKIYTVHYKDANENEIRRRKSFLLDTDIENVNVMITVDESDQLSADEFTSIKAEEGIRNLPRVRSNSRNYHDFAAFCTGLFHDTRIVTNVAKVSPHIMQIGFLQESMYQKESVKDLVLVNFIFGESAQALEALEEVKNLYDKTRGRGHGSKMITVVLRPGHKEVDVFTQRHLSLIDSCMAIVKGRSKRSGPACESLELEELIEDKRRDSDAENRLVGEREVKYRFFHQLNRISSGVMTGLMVKNLVADVINGNVAGMAINTGFILSSILANKASVKLLTKAGKLTARSPALLFVGYDLYCNLKNKDHSITNKVSIGGDIGYLALDITESLIELAEFSGIFGGVAAVTGPISAALGAAIMIGTEIYRAVETVKNIDSFVHLSGPEKFVEGMRAFVGMQPEEKIKTLMDNKQANTFVVQEALKFLDINKSVRRYVVPIKASSIENDGSNSTVTYYDLNNGTDKVLGFKNTPNAFNLASGLKFVSGGDADDSFILNGNKVMGILDGRAGTNLVDSRRLNGTLYMNRLYMVAMDNKKDVLNLALETRNMTQIYGREGQQDKIFVWYLVKKRDLGVYFQCNHLNGLGKMIYRLATGFEPFSTGRMQFKVSRIVVEMKNGTSYTYVKTIINENTTSRADYFCLHLNKITKHMHLRRKSFGVWHCRIDVEFFKCESETTTLEQCKESPNEKALCPLPVTFGLALVQ